MGAMALALGFAVLFNFVILRIKWNRGLYSDIGVDILMLVILNTVFGGSILGVVSATMGSTLISLYLIKFPIKLFSDELTEEISSSFSKTKSKPKKTKSQTMAEKIDSLFN